ncbi:MAG: hypothetical protein ABJE95_17355 [Byssovorax sp.]
MLPHVKADSVQSLIGITLRNGISRKLLLLKCDLLIVANLRSGKSKVEAIIIAIQELNRLAPLADNSVQMLLLLAGLGCALQHLNLPDTKRDRDCVLGIASDLYCRLPIESQRHHEEIGNILFAPVALVAPVPPVDDPTNPGVRVGGGKVNIATLAIAGAFAGGATSILVVLFPQHLGGGAEGLHCTLMGVAAVPAGAVGAIHLWGGAEANDSIRPRGDGRVVPHALVSLSAIVGGGTLNLLAHSLSETPFSFSGWRVWLPLGIAGASGALVSVWSDAMARPSTVLMAAWSGLIAAGGVFGGYAAYVGGVRLLVGSGPSADVLLAPTGKAVVAGAGAFAFVTIMQALMAFHLHGKAAFQLDSSSLAVKSRIVSERVLYVTAFSAMAVTIAYLAQSWASVLRAAFP